MDPLLRSASAKLAGPVLHFFSQTFLQTVTAVPVQTAHGRCEQHEAAEVHKSTGWALQGMRLARGGTSTLPVPARESPSRLAANARAAVMDKMADQRSARADVHAAREGAGTARARQRANRRAKVAASELHSEMAPPGSNKLGVRPLLGSTGNLEGWPCSATAEAARSTSGGEWCDEGGVNGDLGSIPKGKAFGNDLYSALVWPPRLDVQVLKEDVLLDRLLLRGKHGPLLARGARHGNAVPQSAGMPRHGHQGRPSHDGIGKLQVQGGSILKRGDGRQSSIWASSGIKHGGRCWVELATEGPVTEVVESSGR